ncbi:MAG: amino acid ABC transporter substrate-binding protein [Candidatus Dormibacteraceae bacterium]
MVERVNAVRICAVAALAAMIAACGSEGSTSGSGSPSKGPIKIGISISLSGDRAADGKALQQGYQLWADHVNSTGGLLGRQVTLDIVSDASSPSQVVTNYQKLISVDHCQLVFGPFSTALTKAASQVVARYGYAFVEGAGSGPSVFQQGLHNVFSTSLPAINELQSFARWIAAMPPSSRPATAAYATEDDPFTAPQLAVARKILETAGVKTVYNKTYPIETADYGPIAAGIIGAHADIVLAGTTLIDISAFIQQFAQQNYNPRALIASAGPDQGAQFIHAVGANHTEGVMVPNSWYPGANFPGNAAMIAAFLKKYGGTPADISSDVPQGYSVGEVVKQAVDATHSLDNAKIIRYLHSVSQLETVQGPVKFDSSGQNIAAQALIFQWQKGQLLPFELNSSNQLVAVPPGTSAIEYPKPKW